MKTKLSDFLNERLIEINDDVDMIFDMFYREDLEIVNNGEFKGKRLFTRNEIDTSILKSAPCKKAHDINPCDIIINHSSNYYKPSQDLISIGITQSAYEHLKDFNTIEEAQNNLPKHLRESFKGEFTISKMKGSIHHELVHWIDNTLNNNHLAKEIKKASDNGGFENNVNIHNMEIQSQIHNILQLKREYGNIWDELTFDEMIQKSPILNQIVRVLNKDELRFWKLKIKRRMYREGLLGKNMR